MSTSASALPFTAPALLAPMEGVTEPCFRDLVLARNPADIEHGAMVFGGHRECGTQCYAEQDRVQTAHAGSM